MITINGAHEGQHAHGRADEYEIDPAGFLHVYESPDSALGTRRIVASYAPGHWATVVVEPTSQEEPAKDSDSGAAHHHVFPPGEHRIRLYGRPYEITAADYRPGDDTVTMYGKAVRL